MNGGKALFNAISATRFRFPNITLSAMKTAACAFARTASSNADFRSSMPLSSREKTSMPRVKADVRVFSKASACPGNEGFQNTATFVVPVIASRSSSSRFPHVRIRYRLLR